MNQANKTTLEQMGRIGKLQAMVGANKMTYDDAKNEIKFWFKGYRKANIVTITLTNDLYNMTFWKYNSRTYDCKEVASYEGIYADMLKTTFEQETGLYLTL